MKRSKIFFVSSEIYPFVKGGHGAVFAGSFPTYLQMLGHEVRVLMPKYSLINERKYIIRDIIRLKDIPVETDKGMVTVSVKSGFLPESKTQIYFAENDKYYKRSDLYRDKRTGQAFKDNDERFIFLARTALATLRTLGWQPDIIHCCDWATGLLPAMIRQEQTKDSFFKKTVVAYSIHDLEEAGLFDKSTFKAALLSQNAIDAEKCMHKNKLSFLKTGVAYSDAVTIPATHKHLKSIGKPKNDFEQILSQCKNLFDVPTGGDHNLWNPANNNSLYKAYTFDKFEKRKINREEFLEEKKTGFNPEEPILGLLADRFELQQKEIITFLRSIKDLKLQIFFVSDENPATHSAIKNLITKNGNHIVYVLQDPDEQFRHKFFATCDLFFVPRADDFYEAAYLNGIHYGAIPLVSKNHIVSPMFEPIKGSKGDAYTYVDERDLVKKLEEAIHLYKEPDKWQTLAQHAMKTDVSWASCMEPYIKVYERMLNKLK